MFVMRLPSPLLCLLQLQLGLNSCWNHCLWAVYTYTALTLTYRSSVMYRTAPFPCTDTYSLSGMWTCIGKPIYVQNMKHFCMLCFKNTIKPEFIITVTAIVCGSGRCLVFKLVFIPAHFNKHFGHFEILHMRTYVIMNIFVM